MNNTEMHSADIAHLLEALSKAQSIMEGAVEDSANPFFKSTYADLTSVWQACRAPLTKNGLSVTQTLQTFDNQLCLVSILGHVSGQWIKSVLPIKPSKDDIQGLGSAITYCRRYALAALVGVCPADDDGEKAMDRTKKSAYEKEEKVNFVIPDGYNKGDVERYIAHIAQTTNRSISNIKKNAMDKFESFYQKYEQWSEKKKDDELELAS